MIDQETEKITREEAATMFDEAYKKLTSPSPQGLGIRELDELYKLGFDLVALYLEKEQLEGLTDEEFQRLGQNYLLKKLEPQKYQQFKQGFIDFLTKENLLQ